MFKCLILGLTLFTSAMTYSAPNIWRVVSTQGWHVYSINDDKNNTLTVSCFGGPPVDNRDHSVELELSNGKKIENSDSEYPLTFIYDDETEAVPMNNTLSNSGGRQWIEFIEISKAKKVEVFVNNKKVTTFTPSQKNISKTISSLAECIPMRDRDESYAS